ncbi:MAG TPA: Uma2 family endonuclease [Lacipirellulaceae bacterium]|nr:Uma2 family endonuclease [Lacipirellulaceae bacterium]
MSSDFDISNAGTGPAALAVPLTFHSLDTPGAIHIPPQAATWDGFRQWATSDDFPERGKITFVAGGLVVDTSPESFEEQGAVKAEVSRVLLQLVRDRKLGHYRIDGTLISNETAGLSSEPDSVFISSATIKAGRVTFVPEVNRPQSSKEILGTVDWVLEIISPSSRRKDSKLLRDAYFAAGIPEYWLIDPTRDYGVDFQILIRGDGEYVAVAAERGWLASPTFGCSFRLTRERDDDGYWQYTLDKRDSP